MHPHPHPEEGRVLCWAIVPSSCIRVEEHRQRGRATGVHPQYVAISWAVAAARSKITIMNIIPREARISAILDEVWTTDPFPRIPGWKPLVQLPEAQSCLPPPKQQLCWPPGPQDGLSARRPQWRPALLAPLRPSN